MLRRTNLLMPLATALTAIVFIAGCATTRINKFESFARAGTAYTQTLDELLIATGELAVDANSYKLIDSARLTDNKGKAKDLKRANETMRDMLGTLTQLRQQTHLLRRYFQHLAELAASSAPAEARQAIPGLLKGINSLGTALKGSSLLKNPKSAARLGAGAGTLVVRGIQHQALERELTARKSVIAEVLLIHETLLESLEAKINHDLAIMDTVRLRQEIKDPFTAGKAAKTASAARKWVKQRREILYAPTSIAELSAAATASRTLRDAWARLLTNEISPTEIEGLVTELHGILTIVTAARRLR